MIAMLHFATLAVATILAGLSAAALNWLCLRVAFVLMQPATARRVAVRTELVRGTAQLAQAYVTNR